MALSPVVFIAAIFLVVHLQGICVATTASFVHPGVLVSKPQLDYIKQQVQAQVEPFASSYAHLTKYSGASLSYTPRGPPPSGTIECGSYSVPDFGCSNDTTDTHAAYLQALLWYITGNQQYATNAIEIMNKYSSHLKQFNNSNAPLQAAWSASVLMRAAEIIRHTSSAWKADDISAFTNMLYKVYVPLINHGSGANGNWELSMIEGVCGIAVFNEDQSLLNTAIQFYKQRIPAYLYLSTDGNKPVPPPRGSPTWYNQTVFNASVNGICQETCRDFGHTQMGMAAATNTAETALIQGIDLYTEFQSRLTAAYEFHTHYLYVGSDSVPAYVCDGTVKLSNSPTFEIGYNHFHNQHNVTLPNTLSQIIKNVRPITYPAGLMMVWETLTHGGSPKMQKVIT